MIEAAVFDMDGVLIDSEPLWQRAEIEVFADVGIALTPGLCRQTMGLRIDEVVAHWHAFQPWESPSTGTIERLVVDRMGELIRSEGRLLPAVRDALSFAGSKAHLALASSSYYELIDAVLDGFDLRSYFEIVHSAEDEPRGKPDPGIYLTAAQKLGIDPTRCVAIEDSANGVRAAKAAGMKCVAIPSEEPAEPLAEIADVLIHSLAEMDEGLWERVSRR